MSAKLSFIDRDNKVAWISFDPEGSAPEVIYLNLRHHAIRYIASDNLLVVGIPFVRIDPKDPTQPVKAEDFAAWATAAVDILTKNKTSRTDCDRFFRDLRAVQQYQSQGVPA